MEVKLQFIASLLVAAFAAMPVYAQTPPPPSTLTGAEIVTCVQNGSPRGCTVSGIQKSGTQTANTVLAAPNGSAGAPTFRALSAADMAGLLSISGNAALSALPSTVGSAIRTGYATAGDSPPLVYTASSSSCSLSAGAGDGGSQVPTSDGKCWLANIGRGSHVSAAEWGMNASAVDNGVPLKAALAWSDSVTGAYIDMPPGLFTFASTASAACNGLTLSGNGTLTELYGTADFGPFISCTSGRSATFNNFWMQHFIGSSPTTGFVNKTTNSPNMVLTDMTYVRLQDVTFWNGGPYGLELIRDIDVRCSHCAFTGFWDGTNNQTQADVLIDGADGTGNGHPQLIYFDNGTYFQGYGTANTTKTITSGGNSRTITTFYADKGAYDHILVKSVEGLYLQSGIADGAFANTLHLTPRGDTTRPILKVTVGNDFWLDGAGSSDVLIENAGTVNNSYAAASDVHIGAFVADGELSGYTAVSVPNLSGYIAVNGLFIDDVNASAYVTTPFSLLAVNGGYLHGGTIRNYNTYGPFANDVTQSSAVYVGGITTNFDVAPRGVGGDQSFGPINLTALPGTSPYATNQDEYGISIAPSLISVTRRAHLNMGYYQDYGGAVPAVGSCGTGCVAVSGSDNLHGKITVGAGTVTTGVVAFYGAMTNPAPQNQFCWITSAVTSGGAPVAASVSTYTYSGFNWISASSIGGGTLTYECWQ